MDSKKPMKDYPFHKANIHERRWAATFCRMFPLACFVTVGVVGGHATFRSHYTLLWLTALFNLALWLWVVTTSLLSIFATCFKLTGLEQMPQKISDPNSASILSAGAGESPAVLGDTGSADHGKIIKHLIILPNYKEEESMLHETLESYAECEGSESFCIVLGMEEREGVAAETKAENLKREFSSKFAEVLICTHPKNMVETHLDGSDTAEVPGKASNLKYAVTYACETLESAPYDIDTKQLLLTVADADCIFHPLYFSHVARDHERHGTLWTMWQAPQFQYRNYATSPIVSRVWSYISGVYEFGGLAGVTFPIFGCHAMVHSSYTMPLELARAADPWDGDGMAEDHHAFLKCFFFRMLKTPQGGCFRNLDIRPVFLPVKSTAVANEEYLQSWVDRWSQAKRHAQGVSELSYALLATYDAFTTQPLNRMLDPRVVFQLSQVFVRLFCMHILPILQGLCLGMLTATWFLHHRHIDLCPDRLWLFKPGDVDQTFLCGIAGAWVLTWPVVVPMILLMFANFLLLQKVCLHPSSDATIWHSENGKVKNNSSWRVFFMLAMDAILGMSWILFIYGFLVEVIAYTNVAINGNDFNYISANKGVCQRRAKQKFTQGYGAIDEAGLKEAAVKIQASIAGSAAVGSTGKPFLGSTGTQSPTSPPEPNEANLA